MEEHFPGAQVSGIASGLHAIATLPLRYGPPDRFLERMAAAGVAVRPLTDYVQALAGVEKEVVRLVLGYAHVSPARIWEGVRLMPGATRRA